MKETLKTIGNDVVNAGRLGLDITLTVVAIGGGIYAGTAILEKLHNVFKKKDIKEGEK